MLRFQERGDRDAFDALYDRHRSGLLQFIARLCGPGMLAEDVSQGVWLKLLEVGMNGRYYPDPQVQFRTYLFTLARNAVLDEFRRNARLDALDPSTEARLVDSSRTDSEVEQGEVMAALGRAVRLLPMEQREVIALWSSGFSYEEISAMTTAPLHTVIGRKRYGMDRLRAQMATLGFNGWKQA